jgi:hypothetical protein
VAAARHRSSSHDFAAIVLGLDCSIAHGTTVELRPFGMEGKIGLFFKDSINTY